MWQPRVLRTTTLAALVCSALPLTAGLAQTSSTISLADLAGLRTPVATAMSPDGAQVAVTLVASNGAPTSPTHVQSVWLVDVNGRQTRQVAARGYLPRWSPDGTALYFLSGHTLQGNVAQIWTSSAGRNATVLSRSTTAVLDYAPSPDGQRIAYIAHVRDSIGVRPQIHLLDLRSGVARSVTRAVRTIIVSPWDADANLSWSPDSRFVAFSTKPTSKFDDDYQSRIEIVNAENGSVRVVAERAGMNLRPVWSPNGEWIAFRTSFGVVDRFGDHGIGLVSPVTGEIRDIRSGYAGGFLDGPYQYAWEPGSARLYFMGADTLATSLYTIDVRSNRTTRISRLPAQRAALSIARAGSRMAFVMSGASEPWEVHVSELAAHAPRQVTALNPHLTRKRAGTTEAMRWKSGEHQLSGVLVRPANAQRTRTPLVVIVHGGPEGSARIGFEPELPHPSFNYDGGPHPAQLYAAFGYSVFIPNFRGSGGEGSTLRRAGTYEWSRTFLEDITSGIDTLVRRGYVDSNRVYVAGSRSGATKVVSLLTNTTRFRAAYVHNPYPDIVSEYNGSEDFRLMHHGLFGGSPTTRPEVYARESPINAIQRIQTPLLIVADENAFSIPTSQSVLLHRGLLERGVPGELTLYRGRDIPSTSELFRRQLEWFDRWK